MLLFPLLWLLQPPLPNIMPMIFLGIPSSLFSACGLHIIRLIVLLMLLLPLQNACARAISLIRRQRAVTLDS